VAEPKWRKPKRPELESTHQRMGWGSAPEKSTLETPECETFSTNIQVQTLKTV
jgi:hypothetical protein